MFIPGFLISLATFPGVIVHELAHVAFCKFTDTRVLKVCLFRLGNPAGYVIHQQPTTVWRHILIGIGPFFVNTFLGFMLGIIAIPMNMDFDHLTGPQLLLLWLGVSIAMHSFPSTGDARSIWHAVWSKDSPITARVIGSPLVVVIFAGAIGSIFWLDALYGIGVVGAAGAIQKASTRSEAAATASKHNEDILDQFLASHPDVPKQTNVAAAMRSPPADSYDKTIAKISREMNADLPRQLDKQTRLDTTIPDSGKLTYVYTLLGVSADDIDEQALTDALRPSIINGYKTNPKMATLRAKGVVLDYLYRDESGKHITEIVVSPKDF